MAIHKVPWDQLNANTMRAVVRDLGGVGYSTRTHMLAFLESIQKIGHEPTVNTMAQPPVPPRKPAPKAASSSKQTRVSTRKRKSLDGAIDDGFPYGTRNRGKRLKNYHQYATTRPRPTQPRKRRVSEPITMNSTARKVELFDGVVMPPTKSLPNRLSLANGDATAGGDAIDGDSNKGSPGLIWPSSPFNPLPENDSSPTSYLFNILNAPTPGAEPEEDSESVHGVELGLFDTSISIQATSSTSSDYAVAAGNAGPSDLSF